MQLASRFAYRSPALRSDSPLSDDQIRRVAPSIFADAPHQSRSERYSYIPTATVLQELRGEGFEPFMVCQTRVRHDDRRDYTRHMIRLRHASQINGREANEIILLNSHDGTSSYQMLAGMLRFVCQNGLVCGDTVADVRVPHKGDVAAQVADASARTVSLAENLLREQMHPADQFEAFAALVKEGRPVEDIAADFGVSPLVVQRRLRLANVSPRLMADYRAGTVTLEQLMALTITDDHAAQEAAFYDAPAWQRGASALRERLTEREIKASHRLARFVGLDAYTAAGGGTRRDLFADDDSGTYLADFGLLDTLVRGKLDTLAGKVRAEGWAWVEAVPTMSHAERQAFHTAPRRRREPTGREARRIASLETRLQKIEAALEEAYDAEDEGRVEAQEQRRERVAAELQAIEDALLDYTPQVRAIAGAIVTIDQSGEAIIHRGLLREAEAKVLRTLERLRQGSGGGVDTHRADANEGNAPDDDGEGGDDALRTGSMSDRLAQRLSAHRTAALQIEIARRPQVALAALVHGMVQKVLQGGHYGNDLPLGVRLTVQDRLDSIAPDWTESPAAVALRDLQQAAGVALPQDSAELFAVLLAKPQDELVRLLAACVASMVDVVTHRAMANQPGEELARAVGLDMAAWWRPSAEGYFKHVSKAAILQAVGELAPEHVTRLAKLKKADIASEAERLAEGTGWMPAFFKADGPQGTGQDAVTEAPDENTTVIDESEEALAG